MLPICSTRGGLVLRYAHDFNERGICHDCGAEAEIRVDMLTLWRASILIEEPAHRRQAPRARVNGHSSARLSDETDRHIREMLEAGAGINRTARECDVSRQAVRRRVELLFPRALRRAARKSRRFR